MLIRYYSSITYPGPYAYREFSKFHRHTTMNGLSILRKSNSATLFRSVRAFSSYRCLLNDNKIPTENTSAGVPDPGTARHGFDPMKTRKPLSRLPLSGKIEHDKIKETHLVGFLNWKAALLFLTVGGGLLWFFQREKERLEMAREAEMNRGVGKPKIGGPFTLVDHNGNLFTEKDLRGKFSILYFGFSMCPDICPEELEVLSEALDKINKSEKRLQPVFVTCDPNRDTPEVLKNYLSEFHPDIIGLTGPYDEIKDACKAYRVYFSTPPDLKPGQEYLVDHSIFFYLMDPDGKFVDALGRQYTADELAVRINGFIDSWLPEAEREKRKNSWFGFLYKGQD
jgi:protein SCO1